MSDCGHTRYKKGGYITLARLNRLTRDRSNPYVWSGKIVRTCEDCGEDISWAEIVPVKTLTEYQEGEK